MQQQHAKNNHQNIILIVILSLMGQVMRAMSYDYAANELNAVPALTIGGSVDEKGVESSRTPLSWFRMDDGVMGGQSETTHVSLPDEDGILNFSGIINTNGGGFCSIRTAIPQQSKAQVQAVKITFRGDGKTYKLLLSDGKRGGPFSGSPSWQADIRTKNNTWEEKVIPLHSLVPSFGGTPYSKERAEKLSFDISEMKQMGLMLSLKLSNGDANPVETFGKGTFPFSLQVKSIEFLPSKSIMTGTSPKQEE